MGGAAQRVRGMALGASCGSPCTPTMTPCCCHAHWGHGEQPAQGHRARARALSHPIRLLSYTEVPGAPAFLPLQSLFLLPEGSPRMLGLRWGLPCLPQHCPRGPESRYVIVPILLERKLRVTEGESCA